MMHHIFDREGSALSDRKARDVALLTVEVVELPVAVSGVLASRVRRFALLLAYIDARTADDTRIGWQALDRRLVIGSLDGTVLALSVRVVRTALELGGTVVDVSNASCRNFVNRFRGESTIKNLPGLRPSIAPSSLVAGAATAMMPVC
jgi:hypothetical protein